MEDFDEKSGISAMLRLNKIWKDRNLTINIKIKLVNSLIFSIFQKKRLLGCGAGAEYFQFPRLSDARAYRFLNWEDLKIYQLSSITEILRYFGHIIH